MEKEEQSFFAKMDLSSFMISTKTRYIRIWNKWQKIWDWMVRKKYFHQFLAIEPLIFSRK